MWRTTNTQPPDSKASCWAKAVVSSTDSSSQKQSSMELGRQTTCNGCEGGISLPSLSIKTLTMFRIMSNQYVIHILFMIFMSPFLAYNYKIYKYMTNKRLHLPKQIELNKVSDRIRSHKVSKAWEDSSWPSLSLVALVVAARDSQSMENGHSNLKWIFMNHP